MKDSEYLNNWLIKFKDDIPVELGGSCINFRAKFDETVQNWNYKASLWFRKVASLKIALDKYSDMYEQIVWVDIDTVVYGALNNKFLNTLFGDKDCFYFLGEFRRNIDAGVESGLLGFKKDGFNILTDLFKLYDSGDFRNIPRWDDGFVIKTLIQDKYTGISNDCAEPIPRPMDATDIIKVLHHKKGIHGQHNVWHKNIPYTAAPASNITFL